MGPQPLALLRLALPAVFLGLALLSRPLIGELSQEQIVLAGYAPYLLTVVCTVLAFQFNRSRYMLLGLYTGTAYFVIQDQLQVTLSNPTTLRVYLSLCISWPLAMLMLLLFPERGIVNRYGIVYAAIIGLMALLAPDLFSLLSRFFYEPSHWLQIRPQDGFVMPLALAIEFVGVLVLGMLLLIWRHDDAEVAILGTLIAGFTVFAGLHLDFISMVMISAAGLLQVGGVLRSSHTMVYRDELTGLLGRRALNEKLKGLGPRFSLAMLDVDHFKKFNDTHGHDVGDEVLKMVASRLARVRGGGTAFRYGGEEFCIVFPRRAAKECIDVLEEVREAIADYRMTIRDSGARPVRAKDGERKRGSMATRLNRGTVNVTISIGLAERSDSALTPEDVVKAADKQLYRAKKSGRNRLCSG